MPCIDGIPLADLVTEFERARGYTDPAGGYGGIVPRYSSLGPLPSYFLGEEAPVEGDEGGEIYALFCDCGDSGCWPLIAHIEAGEELVIWHRFSQPHRPQRDYSGFGPFMFRRREYEEAIAAAAALDGIG